jgi:hypothetical protein
VIGQTGGPGDAYSALDPDGAVLKTGRPTPRCSPTVEAGFEALGAPITASSSGGRCWTSPTRRWPMKLEVPRHQIGRSIPNALHSELTHTDPNGRIDGVCAPARRQIRKA